MVSKDKTVCFTGHRKIPAGDFEEISRRLETMLIQLIEKGYIYFGAGGALGFDTLAAQTVLKLKTIYPYIKLILVLPCENQAAHWEKEEKLIYEAMKAKADKVVYTSKAYFRGCMHKRNRHLGGNMAVVVKMTKGNRYKVHRILTPEGGAFTIQKMVNAEPTTVGRITNADQTLGGTDPTIGSASGNSIFNAAEKSNGNNSQNDKLNQMLTGNRVLESPELLAQIKLVDVSIPGGPNSVNGKDSQAQETGGERGGFFDRLKGRIKLQKAKDIGTQ